MAAKKVKLKVGAILDSTNGANSYTVIEVGTGKGYLHPPTGVEMPIGTVLENSAGTILVHEWDPENERPAWSSYSSEDYYGDSE